MFYRRKGTRLAHSAVSYDAAFLLGILREVQASFKFSSTGYSSWTLDAGMVMGPEVTQLP